MIEDWTSLRSISFHFSTYREQVLLAAGIPPCRPLAGIAARLSAPACAALPCLCTMLTYLREKPYFLQKHLAYVLFDTSILVVARHKRATRYRKWWDLMPTFVEITSYIEIWKLTKLTGVLHNRRDEMWSQQVFLGSLH